MTRQSLREKFQQGLNANTRLRLAMPLIALLLTLFVWQELNAISKSLATAALSEQSKLERIKSLRGQDVWLARQAETEQALAALIAEIPTIETPGLAQAAVQTNITTYVRSLGITRDIRVAVDQSADSTLPEGVIRIRATLNGGMTPRQAISLLQKIEGASNLAAIELVDIRSGVNRTASMTFSAYYRLAPETSAQ